MKIRISPTHLSSHSAGVGLRSIGRAASPQRLAGRAQQRQSAADREQAGGGEKCRAVLQRRHDLRIDHAGLAVEQAADPFFAVDMHARRQAVAPIGRMLQRHGVYRPFQDEEADRQNIDRICRHIAVPPGRNAGTRGLFTATAGNALSKGEA